MQDQKGAGATRPASIAKIRAAIEETQRALGVIVPVEAWLRPYHQTANRLATLHWLRRELGASRSWLVHLERFRLVRLGFRRRVRTHIGDALPGSLLGESRPGP